jgi:hypothetical protein
MYGGLQEGTNVETLGIYFLGSFGVAGCMSSHSICTANFLSLFHAPVHNNASQAPIIPNDLFSSTSLHQLWNWSIPTNFDVERQFDGLSQVRSDPLGAMFAEQVRGPVRGPLHSIRDSRKFSSQQADSSLTLLDRSSLTSTLTTDICYTHVSSLCA